MKTALIHYWLINNRGGEKVVSELAGMFPSAHLYTHVYDAGRMPGTINQLDVRTTFINRLPEAKKRYQSYLPLMPWALKRLDLSEYDLVISSESGPAKGIRKPAGTLHICYCHTPMRYLWDMSGDYFKNCSFPRKVGMSLLLPFLRKWDLWSATQVDHFLANSSFVAGRIKRIYDREATVIYPPVDVERFLQRERDPRDFYLYTGQLTAYKRADLAVDAFLQSGKRLVLAGEGDELRRLRSKAKPNIEFLGRVSDRKLDDLYSQAKALVFPGIEDFGIVPVEAQAAGCPVIALRAGGAMETVVENETGVFFDDPNADALNAAVLQFERRNISPDGCRRNAQRFSAARFRHQLRSFVDDLIGSPAKTNLLDSL